MKRDKLSAILLIIIGLVNILFIIYVNVLTTKTEKRLENLNHTIDSTINVKK